MHFALSLLLLLPVKEQRPPDGGALSGKKGSVIDAGIIMKHVPTGQWIIGHRPGDAHVKDVGGFTEGPSVINFKKKLFWMC